jgi:hypothetical protein
MIRIATQNRITILPLLAGMFFSCFSTTHSSPTPGEGASENVEASVPHQKSLLQKSSRQYYQAYLIELLATIIEGYTIVHMGSTSAETIKRVGITSAAMHLIKSAFNSTIGWQLRTSNLITAALIDPSFFFKDKKKIDHAVELAAFYAKHHKLASKVRGKRWIQAVILFITASLRIFILLLSAHAFDAHANDLRSALMSITFAFMAHYSLSLPCGIIDFFRKRARYDAECTEFFKEQDKLIKNVKM